MVSPPVPLQTGSPTRRTEQTTRAPACGVSLPSARHGWPTASNPPRTAPASHPASQPLPRAANKSPAPASRAPHPRRVSGYGRAGGDARRGRRHVCGPAQGRLGTSAAGRADWAGAHLADVKQTTGCGWGGTWRGLRGRSFGGGGQILRRWAGAVPSLDGGHDELSDRSNAGAVRYFVWSGVAASPDPRR